MRQQSLSYYKKDYNVCVTEIDNSVVITHEHMTQTRYNISTTESIKTERQTVSYRHLSFCHKLGLYPNG